MAAVQIYYRNCGAQASWWRRGLLHPGGAGSLEKKPWVWTTVVGEEGVLNSGPASPPIELAEVGRELAVACGKQSLLKEVGEVLALVFGVPSTPQDVRHLVKPSLVLVKEERLFPKGMGRRVAQPLPLVVDTQLLRMGRLGGGAPLGGGERNKRGRR